MSIFGELLGSALDVADDLATVAATPVKIALDVTKQATAPVADLAREIADLAEPETKKEESNGR